MQAPSGEISVIEDSNTAKQVHDVMMEMFNKLTDSCELVRKTCSPEEYSAYKKATAALAGAIVFDVIEPLYQKHPALKPANWPDDLPIRARLGD